MDPISLLCRETVDSLTPEEEAALANALSSAYHMDETAASSRDVERIGEKVRARMKELSEGAAADSTTRKDP